MMAEEPTVGGVTTMEAEDMAVAGKERMLCMHLVEFGT